VGKKRRLPAIEKDRAIVEREVWEEVAFKPDREGVFYHGGGLVLWGRRENKKQNCEGVKNRKTGGGKMIEKKTRGERPSYPRKRDKKLLERST